MNRRSPNKEGKQAVSGPCAGTFSASVRAGRFESPSVYVKGWLCEEVGKKTSADRVACLLDTLSFAQVPSADADGFLQTRATREPLCAVRRLPDAGLRLRRR